MSCTENDENDENDERGEKGEKRGAKGGKGGGGGEKKTGGGTLDAPLLPSPGRSGVSLKPSQFGSVSSVWAFIISQLASTIGLTYVCMYLLYVSYVLLGMCVEQEKRQGERQGERQERRGTTGTFLLTFL